MFAGLRAGFTAAVALGLAGCEVEVDDAAVADDLWAAIQGHEAWSQPPGWEGIVASNSHTQFVRVFQNDVAEGWDGTPPAPYGTMMVKEGYNDQDGADLVGYTVMWKLEGYNEDQGDWFWAELYPDGSYDFGDVGAVQTCIACHAASAHDYSMAIGSLPDGA